MKIHPMKRQQSQVILRQMMEQCQGNSSQALKLLSFSLNREHLQETFQSILYVLIIKGAECAFPLPNGQCFFF